MTGADLPRMAFDRDAATYTDARPGYPAELYSLLQTQCGLTVSSKVIEIGAGSGQATSALLDIGAHVCAIEPGQQFAAALRQQYAGAKLRVIESDFEASTLDGHFDLAVAATSFHWVDLDVSLPKLWRHLRPGGWLAVFWNVYQDPARPTAFREALDDVYQDVLPHLKRPSASFPDRLRPESWTGDLEAGGWFGPVQTHFIAWDNILTADGARKLWSTFSNIISLDRRQKDAFLKRLTEVINDEFNGVVSDPCVTAVYLAPRRDKP